MKITTLTAAAVMFTLGASALRGEEPAPAKCPMCEMMKKKAEAKAKHDQQQGELDKLVTEMNGSLGDRKVEAMAAIVTRLVAQAKAASAQPAAAPTPAAKAETHQH